MYIFVVRAIWNKILASWFFLPSHPVACSATALDFFFVDAFWPRVEPIIMRTSCFSNFSIVAEILATIRAKCAYIELLLPINLWCHIVCVDLLVNVIETYVDRFYGFYSCNNSQSCTELEQALASPATRIKQRKKLDTFALVFICREITEYIVRQPSKDSFTWSIITM